METGKRKLARLFIVQILLMVSLLSFVLTFPANRSRTVFSENQDDIIDGVTAPSVYGLLWGKFDMAKTVLRMGFPIVGFLESYGGEHAPPSLVASVFGWFAGFTPRVQKIWSSRNYLGSPRSLPRACLDLLCWKRIGA